MAAAVATVKVSEEAKAALGGLTEASPLDRLHEFCRRGNKPTVMELAAKDKTLLTRKGNLGNTASHWAASTGMEDVLEWVLAQGAPLNAKNDVGDTPLHLAVWKDHLAAVQVLKKRKADKTIANEEGKTAPQMARSQAMKELLPEMDESEIADAIQVVNEDDDDDDDDDAAGAAAAAPAAKPRPPPPKPAGAGAVPKPPPPKPAAPGAAGAAGAAAAAPKPVIKPPPPPPRRA